MSKTIKADNQNPGRNSYCPELYAACRYIDSHAEEFQNFALYKNDNLKDKSLDPFGLHQRLMAQYRLLTGDVKYPADDCVKGSEIVPSIDTSQMDDSVLAKILVVFHHFTNLSEDGRINLKKQFLQINIEKPTDLMNYLVKEMMPDYCSNLLGMEKARKIEDIYKILNGNYDIARRIILSEISFRKMDPIGTYHNHIVDIRKLLIQRKNFRRNKRYQPDIRFDKLKPYYEACLFVDLCCREILQFVIHGIIRNENVTDKMAVIEELNSKMVDLIKAEEIKNNKKIVLEGTADEIMFKFYSYFYMKDKFLQDNYILNIITGSKEKQKNPDTRFAIPQYVLNEYKITWKELQELFNECVSDNAENIRTFKANIFKCFKAILLINEKAGRNINIDPISLKALYRAIYKDTAKYNGRQCKSIVNELVETNKISTLDYYIINEKMNMGIFREYGLCNEFYAKNELQNNLYHLVCLALVKLEPTNIKKTFDKYVQTISCGIRDIVRRYIDFEAEPELSLDVEKSLRERKEILKNKEDIIKKIEQMNENSYDGLLVIIRLWFLRSGFV